VDYILFVANSVEDREAACEPESAPNQRSEQEKCHARSSQQAKPAFVPQQTPAIAATLAPAAAVATGGERKKEKVPSSTASAGCG